jgi:hypothetical protein
MYLAVAIMSDQVNRLTVEPVEAARVCLIQCFVGRSFMSRMCWTGRVPAILTDTHLQAGSSISSGHGRHLPCITFVRHPCGAA